VLSFFYFSFFFVDGDNGVLDTPPFPRTHFFLWKSALRRYFVFSMSSPPPGSITFPFLAPPSLLPYLMKVVPKVSFLSPFGSSLVSPPPFSDFRLTPMSFCSGGGSFPPSAFWKKRIRMRRFTPESHLGVPPSDRPLSITPYTLPPISFPHLYLNPANLPP